MLGAAISHGLSLASAILVGRLLGREIFGELGTIRSTVGMFGTLAGFGLGTTATKYVAEYRDRDPSKAGRVIVLSRTVALVMGSIMAGALMITAPWLARRTLAAPHLASLLQVGGLLLLVGAISGVESGILSGYEAFSAIATRSLWAGLASFPLMLGGAHFLGLTGAVWALVLSAVFQWILYHYAAQQVTQRSSINYTLYEAWSESRILWDFSLPAALSSVMVGPITWACSALLVNQPNGYAEMGNLSAAHQFQNLMVLVGSTLGGPLLSIITNQRSSSQGRLGRANILATWAIGVLPSLPLLAFPEIAEWAFGEGFRGADFRCTVLATVLATSVIIYKQGLARVLTSQNLMWWGLLSNSIWGLLLLGSAVFLVRYGAVGIATSYAIAYALNTIVFVPFYLRRKLIPDGTLVSVEAGYIWLSLLVLAFLAALDVPVPLRAIALVSGTGVILYSFRRMTIERPHGQ